MRRLCSVFFRRSGTVGIQRQAIQPDQAWQFLWKVKEQWQMESNDFVRFWMMMNSIWFLRQLNWWESSCLWCLLPFSLALVTKFWISLWLTNCQKGCLWENGAERSLRLGNLPSLAKHTEMCTSVHRWWDGRILQMEHGSPWEQKYRINCKGLVFFSLGMQSCGGLWKGWKAKGWLRRDFGAKTAGWLRWSSSSIHLQGTLWAGCLLVGEQRVGTIRTLCICLDSCGNANKLPIQSSYSSIHTAQMAAIYSCNGVHLQRGCENLPLVVW